MESITQRRLLWSKERRIEMINLWQGSLQYCYRVFDEVEQFPQGVSLGIDQQLKDSALAISDQIARGSNAVDRNEFQEAIDSSVAKLKETVAHLYLAHKWKYITDEKFGKLYQESKTLMSGIQLFQ